jgi:hypothetical protein
MALEPFNFETPPPALKEALIKWISETLSFFVWQGASSFCGGAGLFRPAPLQKERATQSKRNKSTFP